MNRRTEKNKKRNEMKGERKKSNENKKGNKPKGEKKKKRQWY